MIIEELAQMIVNLKYDELIGLGREALKDFVDIGYKDLQGNLDGVSAILFFSLNMVIGSDGEVSETEHDMLEKIIGEKFNYDDLVSDALRATNDEVKSDLKDLIQALSEQAKQRLLLLCLILASADKDVKGVELKEVSDILGY